MPCIEELLTLEPFQALPTDRLEWACDRANELHLPAGTYSLPFRNYEYMNLTYGQQNPDPAHTQDWQDTCDRGYEALLNPTTDAMTLSDREDELLDWLEDYGVEQA